MNDAASLEMTPASAGALAPVPETARRLLLRMFADPHLLEEGERLALVEELRACVQAHPAVADLRVLYGMALCVNLEVQMAMEELREGVRLAPAQAAESAAAHVVA